jgi:nitrile hydratase beta subunit
MDGVHDMGGMHGFGAAVTPDSEAIHVEAWEVRAQMVGIMGGAVSRAAIERLDPAQYLGSSYYLRWLLAAEEDAVAREIVDQADLERWREAFTDDPELAVAVVAAKPEDLEAQRTFLTTAHVFPPATGAIFTVGDSVRVRRQRAEQHHRCPRYVRGVTGTVDRVVGDDGLPGTGAAASRDEPVYTVQFSSVDLWGETAEPDFELLIDLWQSYLEPM